MLKGLTNIVNGILIYCSDPSLGKAEVSFIYKINPRENFLMRTDKVVANSHAKMENFLHKNDFTIEIITNNLELCDYDYLPIYESIYKKKDIKGKDNKLHKTMLQGTAKMIQRESRGVMKHEYYLKVNTFIYDLKGKKPLLKKFKEVDDVIRQFPEEYTIEKFLDSRDVILALLKEVRFAKNELNSIINMDMKKEGLYSSILKD